VKVRAIPALISGIAFLALAGCGGDETGTSDTFEVPSEAMTPTYSVGEDVDVDRDAYADAEPQPGDIVLVHPPTGADFEECGAPAKRGAPCAKPTPGSVDDLEFMERVVAGPGDEVAFERGAAIVNGSELDEDFVEPCSTKYCDLPTTIKVPPGHWFLAGDNRADASDSRVWGPVPLKSITGQVED
jgi:signal peptidase I